MYLLKLAFRPWRLAPFSQLFSAIAVGFLLFLASFLFWLEHGLKPVMVRLQGEQVITAYLDSSMNNSGSTDSDQKTFTEVRSALAGIPGLEIKLVNSSEFIQNMKRQQPDLVRELEVLGQDMQEVIPRYISVSGILPVQALDKIKRVPGIEFAESTHDRYVSILGAFRALRWVSKVLMAGLALALLSGLVHLTRMNAYLHQDSLSLLKFWGAKTSTLATPGMISGVMVGALGGLIALAGWMTFGHSLIFHVRTLSLVLKEMPPALQGLPFFLFMIGGGLGCAAGVIGSLSASHVTVDRSVET